MNDGYRYPEEDSTAPQYPESVTACKADIVSALGRAGLSVIELVALSRYPYDITSNALHQLETQGAIRKTFELTDQQNLIVGYEITT